jgi:fumarate reductase flavoprotein subunit
MKKMRTWFAADKTGFHMLHTLFQTSLKYTSVVRYDEWFVTKLLVDDGRVQGVVAMELMSGRIEAITARAVILCTGGCGRVFPFTTNASIKTGDGMALAYRAGAPLKDMEFVQYHPTGLPFTGILITEAARAEGGYLINKDGYRYLQDYKLGTPQATPVLRTMELGPRDRLSQAFMKELEKGRTIETPYGPVVHLDLRHLGKKVIDAKIPFVRELCQKYQNLDPVSDLIPVRPVVHYMMGGVHTDINGATPLAGLMQLVKLPASASTVRIASGRTHCRSCSCSAPAPGARPRNLPRTALLSVSMLQHRCTTSGSGWRRMSSGRPADGNAWPTFATRCRRRSKRAPAFIGTVRS